MAGTVRQWMLVDTDVLIDVARRVKGAVDYLHESELSQSCLTSVALARRANSTTVRHEADDVTLFE